ALIPVDLHPGEGVHQLPEALLAVARGIGVLDAEDELAAVVPRVRPVEQRRAHHADMRQARRRGAEAHTDVRTGGGGGEGMHGSHIPRFYRGGCAALTVSGSDGPRSSPSG